MSFLLNINSINLNREWSKYFPDVDYEQELTGSQSNFSDNSQSRYYFHDCQFLDLKDCIAVSFKLQEDGEYKILLENTIFQNNENMNDRVSSLKIESSYNTDVVQSKVSYINTQSSEVQTFSVKNLKYHQAYDITISDIE